MVIKQLPAGPTGEPDIRGLQARMVEMGRIRTGRFNPEGRGRPEKLDKFRLTSTDARLIHAVAEVYGGTAQQYTPQRSKTPAWEVFTEANELPVYVPPQKIEPWLEAWRPGTCIRRCDGVRERQQDVACLCNSGQVAASDVCKPVVRVQLMLADVPGLGTWRLESHGVYACSELSTLAPFVARIPMPVPAMLRLRREERRPFNRQKQKHETMIFYVPWLSISAATPAQFAVGGDALTQALQAAGASPALGTAERLAIEAPPPGHHHLTEAQGSVLAGAAVPGDGVASQQSTEAPSSLAVTPPPVTTARTRSEVDARPAAGAPPNVPISDEERHRILVAIENADLDRLEVIKAALQARNVRDKAIQDAWVSKRNALRADHQMALRRAQDAVPTGAAGYAVGDVVTVAGLRFTKVSEDPFGEPPDAVTSPLPEFGSLPAAPPLTPDETTWLGVLGDMSVVTPPATGAQSGPDLTAQPAHPSDPPPGAERESQPNDHTHPAADLDVDEQATLLFTEAGRRGLNTAETIDFTLARLPGVAKFGDATGAQLAEVRQQLRAGG